MRARGPAADEHAGVGGEQPGPQPGAARSAAPPIAQLIVGSLALIVVGGVYMASRLPGHVPLALPLGLLIGAAILLLATIVTLARLNAFAWRRFFGVGRWALLAYVVIAGMLEYIFVLDHTRGGQLVVLTAMLAVFALDVPILLAFSVARYDSFDRVRSSLAGG